LPEIHAHDRLAFRIFYPAIRVFGRCLLFIFGPVKTIGIENIPKTGGALIIANHLSNLDPVAIKASCNRPICYLSKRELFGNPVGAGIIRWFGAFPIDRDAPDRKALQYAAKLIQEGHLVCIFPEGKLSESGELLPIQPGFTLIARIAKCPMITCRVKNTDAVMPYAKVFPKMSFKRIIVTWNEPIPAEMAKQTDELLERIKKELSPVLD